MEGSEPSFLIPFQKIGGFEARNPRMHGIFARILRTLNVSLLSHTLFSLSLLQDFCTTARAFLTYIKIDSPIKDFLSESVKTKNARCTLAFSSFMATGKPVTPLQNRFDTTSGERATSLQEANGDVPAGWGGIFNRVTRMGSHIFGFLGVRQFFILRLANVPECL